MSDTPFTTIGDEPVEARIVAWVLGEASAFEAAELERLCEERAELMIFKRRMLALHGLLAEAEKPQADESWKLPPDKRRAVEEILGDEKPIRLEVVKEKRIRRSGRRVFLAIAACLVLLVVIGGLTAPMAIRQRKKSDVTEVRSREMQMELADRQLAELNKAVRDQEDKVEERRKVLATIARNKGIIYKGVDSFQGNDQALAMSDDRREEAIKRGLDAQDYADAKREFESDQQLLQAMKLKQIEETIAQKMAMADAGQKAAGETNASLYSDRSLATNSRRQPLRTEFPPELIEGTPKPMNIPNLETPVSGPAGSGSWRSDGSQLAQNEKGRSRSASKSATSPRPSTAPSVRRVMAEGASSNLSLPDVRGELVQREARPRVSNAAAVDATAQPAGIAMRSDSDADPFADESGSSSRLVARQPLEKNGSGALSFNSGGVIPADELISRGNRGGSGPIEKDNIAGNRRNDAGSAGEKAPIAKASEAPTDMPVLGRLFPEEDKSELSLGSDYYDSNGRLSGTNTYSGGTVVTGGALGFGSGGGFAASAPEAQSAASGRVDGAASVSFNEELNQDGQKKDEGKLVGGIEIVGGSKFELKLGNTSEYHFEGSDLSDSETAPKIEIVREFQYPTEAEPPRLPEIAAVDSFPKTPATEEIRYKIDYDNKKTQQQKKTEDEGLKVKEVSKPDLTKLMEEIAATQEPYSTFSLNISDASFQIAQAALAKGERPDPAGIKVEQFYNAVDYGDPAPAAGQPVSCTIEQAAHPVIPSRNLVRIALKTAAVGRSAAQPLRLTLLVDQSGSMTRADRRAAMDTALAGLSKLLTKNDLVSVIGFSRTPRLLADGMTGDKAEKLADLVNQAASEGGTNLEEAIKLGEQLAGRQKLASAQNRIVLFTDGAANLGNADPVRLAEQVKQLRQKGIAFDIAGIAADGLNDELLGELARNGNGRYYVVGKGGDDNFAKQLAGAFRPAAENVKVQVRFNPERVLRYKLIGFEKDRLKTEDFRNDKVDAAELAAEEAGVAIYQVEPNPEGNGELGEVSVRFRDTASGEMVERGWTIPHDAAAPAIDRATPSMQLATLSMFAGEKLKGGPLGEAIDFSQFAEPQANVKQSYGGNARVAEVLRMVDALK